MELEVIIMIINIDWILHKLEGKYTYIHYFSVLVVNVTSCFKLLPQLACNQGLEPGVVS